MRGSARIVPLLTCSFLIAAPVQAQTTASDEAAIRSALASYAGARLRQDADAQAQFYAEYADFRFDGDGQVVRGREEIEAVLRTSVPPAEFRFTLEVEQVRFLSPTIALADATYGGYSDGYVLYVMVKQEDRWLIEAARVAGLPPPSQ